MLKHNCLSNVRARRSRGVPQPTSPAASEAPEDDSSQARKRLERKRATDRAAQREHRKRQKQRVHELEAQLELVKSKHGSESLALLMEENERLQAEVKRLKSFFATIKGFVSGVDTEIQIKKGDDIRPEKDGQELSDSSKGSEPLNGTEPLEDFLGQERTFNLRETMISPDQAAGMTVDSVSHEWDHMASSNDDADPSLMDLFDAAENLHQHDHTDILTALNIGPACPPDASFSGLRRDESHNSTMANNSQEHPPEQVDSSRRSSTFHRSFTGLGHIDSPHYDDTFQRRANSLGYLLPGFNDQVHFNPYCPSPEDLWLSLVQPKVAANWTLLGDGALKAPVVYSNSTKTTAPARSSLESKFFSGTLAVSAYRLLASFEKQLATNGHSRRGSVCEMDYKTLPKVLSPPLQEDIYMHEFIERVRSSTLLNKQLPDEPTLSDFITDSTPNVLSAEVKGFIGLLWGTGARHEFLAVCWIVCLCLRWQIDLSKETFQKVPSWLRPTRIQTEIPHPISIDYMPWPAMRDEMIILSLSHPTEIHQILQAFTLYLKVDLSNLENAFNSGKDHLTRAAICDLRNWKLGEGFFHQYPMWRGLCELPFGQFYDR